jgi:cytochrome c biogenesis protein
VSRVAFFDEQGDTVRTEEVRVNHPASVEGLRVFQEGFGWAPVVKVESDGAAMWSSPIVAVRDRAPAGVPATAMPWRGAIKLSATEPDVMIALELWPDFRAYANFQLTGEPTPMFVQFDPYIRYSVFVGRIDDPSLSTIDTSGLRRVGGGDLHAAGSSNIDVPGAGELRLSFPELRQYSVLLISRDVGIPVVLAAAILVLMGLIPSLYVSRRKVWIRAEAVPGGALVKIGGFALQHKDAFEEEFDRIVRGVGGGAEVQPQEKVGTS